MNKPAKISLGIIILVCIAGMLVMNYAAGDTTTSKLTGTILTDKNGADTWNRHAVDTAISLLRSGDIVLRLGQGAESYLLAQMNRKNKAYSHCGIVMMENGYPFVYHSIGGEDNPDERLRRDSASLFFSSSHNMSIAIVHYTLTADRMGKLRDIVYQYYKLRPRFDMKFDLATDDKLYCAEFVYKAMNKAMDDTAYIKPTRVLGHTFVGIDDLFINPNAVMVWQTGFK